MMLTGRSAWPVVCCLAFVAGAAIGQWPSPACAGQPTTSAASAATTSGPSITTSQASATGSTATTAASQADDDIVLIDAETGAPEDPAKAQARIDKLFPRDPNMPVTTTLAPATAQAAAATSLPGMAVRLVSCLGDPSFRHDAEVTKSVVLDDGKRLLTTGNDGTARLWDLKTGKQLACYRHKNKYVWDAQLLPGQEQFVTSGGENAATIWDIQSGRRLGQLSHTGMVFRLALDAQGRYLAATDDKGVALWDIPGRKKLATMQHGAAVYSAFFRAGDKQLVSGCSDTTIRLWNVSSGKLEKFYKGKDKEDKSERSPKAQTQPAEDPNRTGDIYTIVPSADRKQMLVCCGGRGPFVMDLESGKRIWQSSKMSSAYCGAWSGDGLTVAAMSEAGRLCVLDGRDGSERWATTLANGTHYGVSLSPAGEVLCGNGNVLWRYDVKTGKRVYPADGSPLGNGPVTCMQAIGADQIMDSCGQEIRLWSRQGKLLKLQGGAGEVHAFALSPDGSRLLEGRENSLTLLEPSTGRVVRRIRAGDDSSAQGISFSPDGSVAIVGYHDGVEVYRCSDGANIASLNTQSSDYHRGTSAFAVSDDGLVVTGGSGGMALWCMPDGKLVGNVTGEEVSGCAVAGGPAPKLVSWSEKEIMLWSSPSPPEGQMSDAQLRSALAELGSDRYKVREAAERRMVAVGASVLSRLPNGDRGDLEVRTRLARVRRQILQSRAQYRLCSRQTLDKEIRSLVFHPDGRHFAAIQGGELPDRRLVIGLADDDGIRFLHTLTTDHAPNCAIFDAQGDLLVGNCNGTVGIHRLDLK